MFKFLTSKPLWVNILAGIVVLLLLLLLFLGSLALLTKHGKTMKIPSVTGMSYDQAKKSLESQGFSVQVQDSSAYYDTMKPMQVVKQFPEADNLVKINRTVYLTINRSEAPFIQMPLLMNKTFHAAEITLKQYGLRLGDTVRKPDFARNYVLDQQYNGETIKPGDKIRQGSAITLVLGTGIGGIGGSGYIVPDLVGLTYQQAKSRLDSMNIILGSVVRDPGVRDSADAFISKQNPEQMGEGGTPNRIRPGQAIDIWLSAQRPVRRTDSSTTNSGANY